MRFNFRNASFCLTALVAAFLICLPVGAQVNTGRVSGQITDQSAGAIAGAKVTVIDVARGENRDLVSDAAGEYAAPNLLPGIYTVRAEFMGFETVDRQNVQVTAGSDIHVDITLQAGATTQTVTVTEALPIVNTTNAQTGGTLDNQALSQLPINGRNYRWQANYVPGVLTGVGEGSSNQIVNGFPVTNGGWNMIFDGLISSTFFTLETNAGSTGEGGDATLMPLDAIQEMQVVLNPKAEYGWAPGVTENVALKSGTNTIHGSAYAYGRGTFLDAKNPIAGLTPPVNFEQFGASAGGPIKKDKIFYFGSYEGERITTASTFTLQTPTTAAGLGTSNSIPDAIAAMNAASQPLSTLSLNLVGCDTTNAAIHNLTGATVAPACANKNSLGGYNLFGNSGNSVTETENFPAYGGSNNGLGKIDYHISDHHSLNGSIYIGRYQEYVVPNSGQTFTQQYWEELLGTESDMGRIVEIWTPNSNWLNQARVGVDHANRPVSRAECAGAGSSNPSGAGASTGGSEGGVAGPNYLSMYGLNTQFAAGCGIPTISINGFTGKLGFANNRIDWENPISGADSVSWTHGTHQFKFGGDVRAENFYGAKVLDSISGVVTFGSTNFNAFTGATPLEDFLAGQPATEQIRAASSNPNTLENANVRHITSDKIALFAQDDWRIIPKLTLNFGFRYEIETPEADALGLIGNFAPGTPTGMVQTNQIFKTQLKPEPRIGFAYDVTGKGTTVVRGGGGIMYMIPQLMNYIAGGATIDYGGEPTGATLYGATGNVAFLPTGNIKSTLITPTAVTNSSNNITSGLPWCANAIVAGSCTGSGAASPVFPLSTLAPTCGNGQIGTSTLTLDPSTCTGQGGDPNLKLFPYAFWNLNVQHAFNNNLSLDVAYVGSRTWDLINTLNVNQPTAGITGSSAAAASCPTAPAVTLGCDEYFRTPYNFAVNNGTGSVYPWFGTIDYLVNAGGSTYAGLQLNLTARNIHGFTLNANYTLSHALEQTFEQATGALTNGNNPLDVLHHLSLQASYAVPTLRKVPGQMLEGWGLNGSINMLSGLPLALTDTKDDLFGCGSACADRWDLYGPKAPFNDVLGGAGTVTCYGVVGSKFTPAATVQAPNNPTSNGCIPVSAVANMPAPCLAGAAAAGTSTTVPSGSSGSTGLLQLARIGCYVEGGSALVPPAQGMEGTMYPNELRGKGFGLLNLSVTKNWTIKERLKTQFRWEIFNVLNRTQYAAPGVNLGTPSALGLAVSTPDVNHGNAVVGSGGPREMQLALRFDF